MIQTIKTKVADNHIMKEFCKRTGVSSDSVLGIFVILIVVALDSTFIGTSLNNLVCLFFPLQETMAVLKSHNPNVKDMRRCLIVLMTFACLSIAEPLLKHRIPLFAAIKIAFLVSVTFKQSMQEIIQTNIINNVPIGTCNANGKSTISNAAEKAHKAVSEAKAAVNDAESDKNK
ncbi:hypothetical protein ECANGB1_1492 [Enterospora canceri]|uniref:Uncharacterized protein n=1 Tax=Enterospora canceri TaxID=1081671 RepID=A0A1Y1S755_9MICR|nr:hypothetical protein ECANGB1_1492 [Enterospora canceri]